MPPFVRICARRIHVTSLPYACGFATDPCILLFYRIDWSLGISEIYICLGFRQSFHFQNGFRRQRVGAITPFFGVVGKDVSNVFGRCVRLRGRRKTADPPLERGLNVLSEKD